MLFPFHLPQRKWQPIWSLFSPPNLLPQGHQYMKYPESSHKCVALTQFTGHKPWRSSPNKRTGRLLLRIHSGHNDAGKCAPVRFSPQAAAHAYAPCSHLCPHCPVFKTLWDIKIRYLWGLWDSLSKVNSSSDMSLTLLLRGPKYAFKNPTLQIHL